MAKVLANRLKVILPQVISDNQRAFVPERLITDNVLIAYKLLHQMNSRRRGKKEFMALKLDMSKAYDRVEWSFLEQVMLKLGFCEEWVKLVMMCVTSVSFSVLVNGSPSGFIKPTRGIRQGDPLSPYLFLLCAEGLTAMIRAAEIRRSISGMAACRGGSVVSHLLFADDSIVFCQADPVQCQNLLMILEMYEKASGQAMNREKTALFFSKNTSSETKDKTMRIVRVSEIKSHEQYLGLPSIIGRSKKKAFDGLKDRLWKRLNGWQEHYLSIAGKETLIKAVAQAIPIYTMQCFMLPKSFCQELNSMVSKFWWGHQSGKGKIHWLE